MTPASWCSSSCPARRSRSATRAGYSIFGVNEDGATRVVYPMPGPSLVQDVNGQGDYLFVQETDHRELFVRTSGAERDLSWLTHSVEGALTPDGRTLAFTEAAAAMGANYRACVRGTDGSPVVQLGEGALLDLSRDGKWVLALVPSEQRLVACPVGAGDPVPLQRGELARYVQAQWFRDASRVLVNAVERGRGLRFYVQELRGGAPRPVTPEGTSNGRLAPDEKSILAVGPTGAFALYPIREGGEGEGGEPRPVGGLSADDRVLQWSGDDAVLVARFGPVPCLVERVELDSGRREPFLTLAPPDLSGLVGIVTPYVSEDLASYVYSSSRRASRLFVAERTR